MQTTSFENYGLKPYGAVPTPRQLERLNSERTAFFHFGVNTFSDLEWGRGMEEESLFNPTEADCRQWIRTIKNAGFKTAVLTAKHHDGFCLWPSKYTEHTVANSPYKNGRGDLVREFTDACRAYGVRPGIYLSPWDRNAPFWGQDAYNDYYVGQLTELLTNYGDIYEVWWDGAGSSETRYDWGRWACTVRDLQPKAVIFGGLGAVPYADLRWVGNESGFAGEGCFMTVQEADLNDPERKARAQTYGTPDGDRFMPAEVDISIRPGWFYHAEQDALVRTPANLVKYWFTSVGRNALMMLNLPPDRRGLVHEADAASLREFSDVLAQAFAVNLAKGGVCSASSVRAGCEPENMLTDCDGAFYAAADGCTAPVIEIQLPKAQAFNCFLIREVIELGQRVRGFKLEAYVDGAWTCIADKGCIGHTQAAYFETVTSSRVRLTVTASADVPVLRYFGLYLVPEEYVGEERGLRSKVNLMESSTAQAEFSGNEVILDLGGNYEVDTIVLNNAPFLEFSVWAFDGAEFYKVKDCNRPGEREIVRFDPLTTYKLKILRHENDAIRPFEIEVYTA